MLRIDSRGEERASARRCRDRISPRATLEALARLRLLSCTVSGRGALLFGDERVDLRPSQCCLAPGGPLLPLPGSRAASPCHARGEVLAGLFLIQRYGTGRGPAWSWPDHGHLVHHDRSTGAISICSTRRSSPRSIRSMRSPSYTSTRRGLRRAGCGGSRRHRLRSPLRGPRSLRA